MKGTTMALVGLGLVGVALLARRRKGTAPVQAADEQSEAEIPAGLIPPPSPPPGA